MAEVIWTEPALSDLDTIADYIALGNPDAARRLVGRVLGHAEQLETHPRSGPKVQELPGLPYRQLVEPPCRIFYRQDGDRIYVVHVQRSERLLSAKRLASRDPGPAGKGSPPS